MRDCESPFQNYAAHCCLYLSLNDGQFDGESVENDGGVEAVGAVPMRAIPVFLAMRLRDDEEEGEDDEDEAKQAPNQRQQIRDEDEESRAHATQKARLETRVHLASAKRGENW